MKKNLLKMAALAVMMMAGTSSMNAQEVMIGNLENPDPVGSFPLWTYYECSQGQWAYSADDLAALEAGNITSMSFAITGGQDLYTHLSLWVVNTDEESVEKAINTDDMTLVYDNADVYLKKFEDATKTNPGYLTFEFSEPFAYTGGGLRFVLRSFSDYWCAATFNFVMDAMGVVNKGSVKNASMEAGFYANSISNNFYGTQFPVVKLTRDENTATGITTAKAEKSNALYNVAGQKVDASAKGLIISADGKKYLRK